MEKREVEKENLTEVKKIIKNKSFLFLVPLLCAGKNSKLINSYLGYYTDNNPYKELNDILYIESTVKNYLIERNQFYIGDFKSSEGNIIYVLKYNPLVNTNLQVFLEGKYSKFTEGAKRIISSHYPHLKEVFDLDPNRKRKLELLLDVELSEEAELFPIVNLDLEIYMENTHDNQQQE